ncbi:MAG: VWA domain-containing protein [Proteobacteria bacterium]|nr:VWA domain-containing protein [Pseudomonadota bacterium]
MAAGWVHGDALPIAIALAVACAAALAVAGWRAHTRRRRLLGRAAGPATQGGLTDFLLWATLVLIVIAWAGPRWSTRSVSVPRSNLDLVLLLDVSRSMDARDVAPSRFARGQQIASSVLDALLPGDRAALAVFAGRGVLLTPLTPDRRALAELIPGLDTRLVQPQGSRLVAGVSAALEAFSPEPRPRVLVVVSDGETHGERPGAAAAVVAGHDVHVVAAALGTEAGTTIPDHGTSLRDDTGNVVTTRRRLSQLADLADAGGGRVWTGDAWGRVDVGALLASVRGRGTAASEPLVRELPAPAAGPLAAAAFLLWSLEAVFVRRRLRLRPVAALALFGGLLLGAGPDAQRTATDLVAMLEDRARVAPLGGTDLVRLGLARAELGDTEAAERALEEAGLRGETPALRALAWYDLGVLAVGREDWKTARDHFWRALSENDDSPHTRFNYEWTRRRALAQSPAAAEAPPPRPPPARAEPPRRESTRRQPPPPELTPGEGRRWLARVSEDPRASVRNAVAAGEDRPRRRTGPAW